VTYFATLGIHPSAFKSNPSPHNLRAHYQYLDTPQSHLGYPGHSLPSNFLFCFLESLSRESMHIATIESSGIQHRLCQTVRLKALSSELTSLV
jgi:hypothetical protein